MQPLPRFTFEPPSGDRPWAPWDCCYAASSCWRCKTHWSNCSRHTLFWQFQVLRSVGNLSFIVLWPCCNGLRLIVPVNWRPVYLRAVMLTICMFFFFLGRHPIDGANGAGLYTYPLFVSLLAVPILGETVGPWRQSALALGAGGGFLMLDPLSETFSSVHYRCRLFLRLQHSILRRHCRHESPLALTAAVAVLFIITGSGSLLLSLFPPPTDIVQTIPFVAIGWPELTGSILLMALLCSVLNIRQYLLVARLSDR